MDEVGDAGTRLLFLAEDRWHTNRLSFKYRPEFYKNLALVAPNQCITLMLFVF